MPGVEDWTVTPLSFVAKAFREGDGGKATWSQNVEKFFTEKLVTNNESQWKSIVSINDTPNHMLLDGQMARFRGMIQDMFEPELYAEEFTVKDLTTGATRRETGRYKDSLSFGPKEEIIDQGAAKTAERNSYYCVSIPGEAPWTKEYFKRSSPSPAFPSGSVCNKAAKRSLDDEEDEEDTADQEMETSKAEEGMECNDSTTADSGKAEMETKRSKADAKETQGSPSQSGVFSQPAPNSKGKSSAVIVKLYGVEDSAISLNDSVEFVGILSVDPSLGAPMDENEADEKNNDIMAQFSKVEISAKNPPASLIPRLHVVAYKKLDHLNPLLPMENELAQKEMMREEVSRARDELHAILTKLCFDDPVCADYLICHLVSKIYLRKDVLALGKFSLNLFSVPLVGNWTKRLATIIQLLVTQSQFLPMSIESLNKSVFTPTKDYDANRLVTGALQLAAGTHLILDETAMTNGQLSEVGVRNLTALGNVIQWQRLEYDFKYHQLPYDTDIPCLVLSEGRSLLPHDVQVMMKAKVDDEAAVAERFASVGKELEVALLERLRKYITLCRNRKFDLSDEMQKFVEEDFVATRQASPSFTTDDLHSLMVLARLLSLSKGEAGLTKSIWTEAKAMEAERKQRMAHLPKQRIST